MSVLALFEACNEREKEYNERGQALEEAYKQEMNAKMNDLQQTFDSDGRPTIETYAMVAEWDSTQDVMEYAFEYNEHFYDAYISPMLKEYMKVGAGTIDIDVDGPRSDLHVLLQHW